MMTFLPGSLLIALLALAVWHDVKSRRIPNKLVFPGMVLALILHAALPSGAGFFDDPAGGLGIGSSLAGLGIGLASLLPMYAMRAMGAGDVKLMAMVGAFLGPQATLIVVLLSLVSGGIFALAVALWNGVLLQTLTNLFYMLQHTIVRAMAQAHVQVEAPPVPSGKLAYAIAIASGTGAYILLFKTNAWSLWS